MNSSGSSSVSLSSWHTPTQAADRPVSPPRAKVKEIAMTPRSRNVIFRHEVLSLLLFN